MAQKFGCKGLLIYSDPSKYAPSDTPMYPDGPSLPQFGIQRGSLLSTPGDPATPSLPSIGENFFFFFFFKMSCTLLLYELSEFFVIFRAFQRLYNHIDNGTCAIKIKSISLASS